MALPVYSKHVPSASTDGLGIPVIAVSPPGNTVHVASTVSLDELWLFVANRDSVNRVLTVAMGSTSSSHRFSQTVESSTGMARVIPGHIFTGGVIISVWADSSDKLTVWGWVNRIS